VLLRPACLTVANILAALRLLPMSDRDKDVEILALRHQITVLERQLGPSRARFAPEDRAFLDETTGRLRARHGIHPRSLPRPWPDGAALAPSGQVRSGHGPGRKVGPPSTPSTSGPRSGPAELDAATRGGRFP
jgi:hypothetical protein